MCITMGFKFRFYLIAITFAACSHEPLPVLGEIPPFELLDNFNQPFTEKNISGKIGRLMMHPDIFINSHYQP